jgi:protein-arginine kinase activator protein McsA
MTTTKIKEKIAILEACLDRAVAIENYEYCAALRDRIAALRQLLKSKK